MIIVYKRRAANFLFFFIFFMVAASPFTTSSWGQSRSADEGNSPDRTRTRSQTSREIRRQERDLEVLERQVEESESSKRRLEAEKVMLSRELANNRPSGSIVGRECDLQVCNEIASDCKARAENRESCGTTACNFGRDCFALYQSPICRNLATNAQYSATVGQCWKIRSTQKIVQIEDELRTLTLALPDLNERLTRARDRLEDLRADDDGDCPDGTCQNTRQNSAQNVLRREVSFLDYMPYIAGFAGQVLNLENQRDIRDLNWATTQEVMNFQLQQQRNYAGNYANYVRGATLLDQNVLPPNGPGGTFGANISTIGTSPYAYQYMLAGQGGNAGMNPLTMGNMGGMNLGGFAGSLNIGGYNPFAMMGMNGGNQFGLQGQLGGIGTIGGYGNLAPLAGIGSIGGIGGIPGMSGMNGLNLGGFAGGLNLAGMNGLNLNGLNGGFSNPQMVGAGGYGAGGLNLGGFAGGLNLAGMNGNGGYYAPQAVGGGNGFMPGGAFGSAGFNSPSFIGSPFGNSSMGINSLMGVNGMGGGSPMIQGFPGVVNNGFAGGTVPGSIFGQQFAGGPVGGISYPSLSGGNNAGLMSSLGQGIGGYQQNIGLMQQQYGNQMAGSQYNDARITMENINYLQSRLNQLLQSANSTASQSSYYNMGSANMGANGNMGGYYAPSVVGGTPPGFPGNIGSAGYAPGVVNYSVPPYNTNYNTGNLAYNGVTWNSGFGANGVSPTGALQPSGVRTSF